jgi:hypothetical protein
MAQMVGGGIGGQLSNPPRCTRSTALNTFIGVTNFFLQYHGSGNGHKFIFSERLYPVGTGLTPKKVIKQAFPTTVAGLVGLNRPAVNALSALL